MKNVLVCLFGLLVLAKASAADPVLLDDFADLSRWHVVASEGVKATIAPAKDGDAPALRLNYDFQSGAGYCIVRRELPMDLPADYRFTFRVRGENADSGPARRNNLEFKLVDPSGDNVWWVNRREFEFPSAWRTIRDRARHFSFAWGPSGGARLERLGAIEFAVSAAEGGNGSVYLSHLTFEPVTEPAGPAPAIRPSASSGFHTIAAGLKEGEPLRWKSSPTDKEPWIELDLGRDTDYGGLVIDWDTADYAVDYDVMAAPAASEAGSAAEAGWTTVAAMRGCRGGRNWIPVSDGEAERLRVEIKRTSRDHGVAVRDIAVKDPRFGSGDNAFFGAVAADLPRAWMPRYFAREQTYWTVVGVPGGATKALLSQDGALEVAPRGFSVEPMVIDRRWRTARLTTWADVKRSQRLEGGCLPIPSVSWESAEWKLETTACGIGDARTNGVVSRYTLTNTGGRPATLRLALAIRPFQVLPPWENLNITGGVSPISRIERDGSVVKVQGRSGERSVELWTPPTGFGATTFARGEIVGDLAKGELPAEQSVDDPMGFASGAMVYEAKLGPEESMTVVIGVPLDGPGMPVKPHSDADAASLADEQIAAAAAGWEAAVGRVHLELPADAAHAQQIMDTFRTAQADLLLERSGDAIEPGTRTYDRSWIRDGSLGCAALLATGHPDEARRFIDWYAEHQFPSGKIPCVVDRRGPDPVDEHDSTGEYIFAVKTCVAFTGDKEFLARHLPHVEKGVEYLQALRATRMTPEYANASSPLKRACYGLVPESISHEGYSAKPMHSYWDSFWTLEGLTDAAWLERAAGNAERTREFEAARASYRRCLLDSVVQATRLNAVDYMPGCVELGDFDPSSTAIAAYPCGELNGPLEARLRRTFEKYWDFFCQRRSGLAVLEGGAWTAYAPYEIRLVGAFARLHRPERASELLDFFFQGQRPAAWNQWAEVVWRDASAPRFIGDMPHGWVASEFINAVRSMFVYEQEHGDALVLAAGVVPEWLAGAGVSVQSFPTEYGPVSYTMRQHGDDLEISLSGPERWPSGGVMLRVPGERAIERVTVDGRRATAMLTRDINLRRPAAEVVIRLAAP